MLLRSFKQIRELPDMNSDAQNKGLEANLVIDRATASRMGITPEDIDKVLYDAFGEREIATRYTPLNQYYVVMVVDPSFWQDPTALRNIYVASSSGGMVPLSAFTHYQASTAPLAVNHSSVFPSVTFSFNLAPGVALGDAVKLIDAAEKNAGMPSTITGSFSGTAQAFTASLSTEPLLIAAAIAAVYVVLINNLGGGWSTAEREQTERMAMHPPAAGKAAQISGDTAAAAPNPPPMPLGEIRPDDLIRQNEDAMAPAPPPAASPKRPDRPEQSEPPEQP